MPGVGVELKAGDMSQADDRIPSRYAERQLFGAGMKCSGRFGPRRKRDGLGGHAPVLIDEALCLVRAFPGCRG